ncbi:MAG: hypothetical protein B6D59_02595 [Campylobacteraceae bacterium 4484_4]|nr:MAG: hypothetical protein B6D59_02595 [Campylobacteraceae bacterium 4484_4]
MGARVGLMIALIAVLWLGGCGTTGEGNIYPPPDDFDQNGPDLEPPTGPSYDLRDYFFNANLWDGQTVSEALHRYYLDSAGHLQEEDIGEVIYEPLESSEGITVSMFVDNNLSRKYLPGLFEITEYVYDTNGIFTDERDWSREVRVNETVSTFTANGKRVYCYLKRHYDDIFEDIDVMQLAGAASLDDRRSGSNGWYYTDVLEISCVTRDPLDRVEMLFANGYGRIFATMQIQKDDGSWQTYDEFVNRYGIDYQ